MSTTEKFIPPVPLGNLQRKLMVYQRATGNARIKPETLERMFKEVIDECGVLHRRYYS